ncbi:hypothetical protein SK128_000743 [Halocaridina rubra]|uniref:Uncharacterized protein n=1 Tax=Halocaridina rubra TaxID=373956 RepID=A0AAN8X4Y5_HALRR
MYRVTKECAIKTKKCGRDKRYQGVQALVVNPYEIRCGGEQNPNMKQGSVNEDENDKRANYQLSGRRFSYNMLEGGNELPITGWQTLSEALEDEAPPASGSNFSYKMCEGQDKGPRDEEWTDVADISIPDDRKRSTEKPNRTLEHEKTATNDDERRRDGAIPNKFNEIPSEQTWLPVGKVHMKQMEKVATKFSDASKTKETTKDGQYSKSDNASHQRCEEQIAETHMVSVSKTQLQSPSKEKKLQSTGAPQKERHKIPTDYISWERNKEIPQKYDELKEEPWVSVSEVTVQNKEKKILQSPKVDITNPRKEYKFQHTMKLQSSKSTHTDECYMQYVHKFGRRSSMPVISSAAVGEDPPQNLENYRRGSLTPTNQVLPYMLTTDRQHYKNEELPAERHGVAANTKQLQGQSKQMKLQITGPPEKERDKMLTDYTCWVRNKDILKKFDELEEEPWVSVSEVIVQREKKPLQSFKADTRDSGKEYQLKIARKLQPSKSTDSNDSDMHYSHKLGRRSSMPLIPSKVEGKDHSQHVENYRRGSLIPTNQVLQDKVTTASKSKLYMQSIYKSTNSFNKERQSRDQQQGIIQSSSKTHTKGPTLQNKGNNTYHPRDPSPDY